MRNILPLIIAFILCSAFGDRPSRDKYRIKTITQYWRNDSSVSEYSYNADGYILQVKNSKGNDIGYEYLDGRILRRYYDALRQLSFVDTLTLDKDKHVVRVASNNRSILSETRVYEANAHPIRTVQIDSAGKEMSIAEVQYKNGDKMVDTRSRTNGNLWYSSSYQYYTDHANTIGEENMGSEFVGKGSAHLVKYESRQMVGTPPVNTKYSYRYDEKGRVLSRTGYDVSTGRQTDSAVYSYYSGVQVLLEK